MNVVFVLLLVVAAVAGAFRGALRQVGQGAFDGAAQAVTLAIGLVGVMALWLGLMKVAERAGLVEKLARAARPILRPLFPGVPDGHPALSAMLLNIAANMLGLGNAATPFGIKAMEQLDTLNPGKGTATDAQALFLAINTASLQLVPTTVIALRASAHSADPAGILLPTLAATSCAFTAAVATAKVMEGVWTRGTLFVLAGLFAFVGALAFGAAHLDGPTLEHISSALVLVLLVGIPAWALARGVRVYEAFVEGAKEGFNVALRIIPFLVAILAAVGAFRAAGAMDVLAHALSPVTARLGIPPEILPMALVRPFSGSGALGLLGNVFATPGLGPDSYAGKLGSILQGSTETTFYVLSVYCGAVGIVRYRHALAAGLLADLTGLVASVAIARALWGH